MNYKKYLEEIKEELDLDNYFDIGGLIFEARVYAGISQEELARRMDTKQSSIARAESGKIEPSIGFLEKVARAVNTKLVYPKFEFMSEEEIFYKSSSFEMRDYSNEIKIENNLSISFNENCFEGKSNSLLKC